MYIPEHLTKWTSADPATGSTDNYCGETPCDHYVGPVSVNRESRCLERANWEVVSKELESLGGEIHRFGHWAVGWYELVLISDTAEDCLQRADYWAEKLDNYPVADETVWSEMEYEEAYRYWEAMGISSRVQLCTEAGISIFAARHVDVIPDSTLIWDSLTAEV